MKDDRYLLGAVALNFFVSLIDCLLRVNEWPVTFSFGYPSPYLVVYQGAFDFHLNPLSFVLSFLLTFAVIKLAAKLIGKNMNPGND